ncbi:MAG TPA: DUF1800 domain-containing protein [Chloroflexota bacterium]|nr:DUF1800 domain-containing protein [Chloroflexota bacterium]
MATESMRRQLSRAALLGAGVAALRAAVAEGAESRSGAGAPLTSERDKVAHLLRRAGFGASALDLQTFTRLGVKGTVDYLVDYEAVPDDVEERLQRYTLNLDQAGDMQRWWLLRMIYTRRPLLEKMVLFWHGLLVSGTGKVGLPQPKPEDPNPPNLMLGQNHFFREHALDDFGSLLKGIARDPAMVVYLDSNTNRKGAPNENFARELLELFSLGVTGPQGQPNYTEDDVREAARAFTGWNLNGQRAFTFYPARHDGGPKTVFGHTGNFGGDEVIDLIVAHPSCAWYICGRLFSFFAYDDPAPEVLAPLVETFRGSGGSIRAVVRAILTSPAFYSERAYRAKVKSPAELIVGVARALELETDGFGLQGNAQRMGQTLFNPPNVAGWPGGARWLTSTTWLERLNFVNRLLGSRRYDEHTHPVALDWFAEHYGLHTPERALDHFLTLLLDGQVRPQQRQTLLEYLQEGNVWPSPARPLLATDQALDRKLRGLVYLIMCTPEYQLA